FIGTLLEQNIHALQVITQELSNPEDVAKRSSGPIDSKEQQSPEVASKNFFQLDFIATILTDTGEPEKVHVEIQKIKNFIEPRMLSNFQAVHYNRRGTFDYEKRKLPSITIYILGFNLQEIQSACIKLENTYEDLISNKMINHKIDFIEKLSQDCYIVQVNRITERFETSLDKLLSIFEQSNFLDGGKLMKDFNHEIDEENIKLMIDILHHASINPEQRKIIEIEQE
ncbi:MAG: hypothetical protein ACK49K_17005, partial [Bacteroidota bacterium]